MQASLRGHAAVVRLLLEKGALADARNNKGSTALMFAAREGNTEVVEAAVVGEV